jgi:MYXO-CTERM domain-containing protein
MNKLAILLSAAAVTTPHVAEACGCLALPSPATNVVQAGERILFHKDGDNVVAYIQVQYTGDAADFAWLVPLPSVPTLDIGTDELFTRLGTTTLPRYTLTTTRNFCDGSSSSSRSSAFGCGAESAFGGRGGNMAAPDAGNLAQDAGALVERSSIGPYDYAVLKADDQSEMLKWLNDNRFFVPAGTDTAIKPYVRPGAFFLAIKLKAGETTGDIVPVIVKYKSDLPMIPIILTQVGAVPNMGIQVYVLGKHRATPRNYHHTVLDDMTVWLLTDSYNAALIRAAKEAPKRHTFLTEYAGTSALMRNVLVPAGRFGSLATLRTLGSPSAYLAYLRTNGYRFDPTLLAILQRHLPMPDELVQQGVGALQYYNNYDAFQTKDGGASMVSFDPAPCTDEIDMRIVTPTKKTQALFDQHPYLTRLYTALSPEDMTDDPVFGENPDLPEVPLEHNATVTIPCRGASFIRSDRGFESQYPKPSVTLPASERIEILRDSGPPELVTDNRKEIESALGPVSYGESESDQRQAPGPLKPQTDSPGCGCRVDGGGDYASAFLMLAALAMVARTRRKRSSAMRR